MLIPNQLLFYNDGSFENLFFLKMGIENLIELQLELKEDLEFQPMTYEHEIYNSSFRLIFLLNIFFSFEVGWSF